MNNAFRAANRKWTPGFWIHFSLIVIRDPTLGIQDLDVPFEWDPLSGSLQNNDRLIGRLSVLQMDIVHLDEYLKKLL